MASWTAVSALPWHHSMLDVDSRAGLAGETLGLGANSRSALTLRYSGVRNRRYLSRTFHGDDPPRLPANSGRGQAFLPAPLLALEHELREAGVLCAEWNSGDEADDRGALGTSTVRRTESSTSPSSWGPEQPLGSPGRRRPLRKILLALTSTGDGGPPPPPGRPKSKSLAGAAAVVVHRMEKSSAGSMSMKDLELPKEWPRSASTRRSNDGCAPHSSHP